MKAIDAIARLLATENLRLIRGNYATASFDCAARILRIPDWEYLDKDCIDLLVSHEVGHALWTPVNGIELFDKEPRLKGCPFSTINILEDIRIERMIQDRFPGLISIYRRGYAKFVESDLFKIKGVDLSTLSFFNRLNIHAKVGAVGAMTVPMSADDMKIYAEAYAMQSFDDVLNLAIKLWQPVLEERSKQEAKPSEEDRPDAGDEGESGEGAQSDMTSSGGEKSVDKSLDDNAKTPDKDSDDGAKTEGKKDEESKPSDGEGDGEGEASKPSEGEVDPTANAKAGGKPETPTLNADDFKTDVADDFAESLAKKTADHSAASPVIILDTDFTYALSHAVVSYKTLRERRKIKAAQLTALYTM